MDGQDAQATHTQQAEPKLEADVELAALIDAMPEALAILDLDGQIVSANAAHLEMLGHKRTE